MVEVTKPKITILQDTEYYLLFIGTMLLVFLTVSLYFSKEIYKKKYNVIDLPAPQTVLDSTVPTGAITVPNSVPTVLPNGLTLCNQDGQCVMNKEIGVKKCPEGGRGKLFYNPKTEICVDKLHCVDPLKYAVNSDGSVNKNGICEPGLDVCMCTSDVRCPTYVTTKFTITNGNLFSTLSSEKNFLINQVPFTKENVYQGNFTIDPLNEYCKLNSTYTEKITNGCSFTNSISDFLMDCDRESADETASVSPYSLTPYVIGGGKNDHGKQFCEIQGYDDSNWNNMTLCMSKDVCKEGNFTYNFDRYRKNSMFASSQPTLSGTSTSSVDTNVHLLNSRRFCQSYASDLKSFRTDLQFYTLSCINGTKCNQLAKPQDTSKFFVGENNEYDPTAIQSKFDLILTVDATTTTISPSPSSNLSSSMLYKMMNSGDIIKKDNKYYIVSINKQQNTPSGIPITLYDFTNDAGAHIAAPTEKTTNNGTASYYPQYAFNGFGYNTKTFFSNNQGYKVSNVYNTATGSNGPDPLNNSYTPLFDILNNTTFYRGGLSYPAGYVMKNEVREQEVLQELDEQLSSKPEIYTIKKTTFNPSLYEKISFYSSVWNNQYGRTECIRCSPLLVASVNMARVSGSDNVKSYQYDAVTIQYSGQDFGHYRRDFRKGKWSFTSTGKPINNSTTNTLYLKTPNFNVQKGDYILSSTSNFEYDIKPLQKLSPQFNGRTCIISKDTNYFSADSQGIDIGANNNFYEYGPDPEATITATYVFNNNNFTFTLPVGSNCSFGNKYIATFSAQNVLSYGGSYIDPITNNIVFTSSESYSFQVAVVPKNRVTSIDDTKKIIKTDSGTNYKLNKGNTVQFISPTRVLELENEPSIVMPFNATGSEAKISISEITDGRITSINVDQPGTGYTNISPKVMFKHYDQYLLNERSK